MGTSPRFANAKLMEAVYVGPRPTIKKPAGQVHLVALVDVVMDWRNASAIVDVQKLKAPANPQDRQPPLGTNVQKQVLEAISFWGKVAATFSFA